MKHIKTPAMIAVDAVKRTYAGEFISPWDMPKVSDFGSSWKAAVDAIYEYKTSMPWSEWFTKACHAKETVEGMKR